jgi:hypothetical protein
VVKLTSAIERVGIVACQFALWVTPINWWEAKKEPNMESEANAGELSLCAGIEPSEGWVLR